MYSVVFVLFASVGFVLGGGTPPMEKIGKCRRLMHPETLKCCKVDISIPEQDKEKLDECKDIPHEPHSCKHAECVASKFGFATADGGLDKKAFMEFSEKDDGVSIEFKEAVKTNCIEGTLEMYGPPDMCELMKLRHCVSVQAVELCPEWDDKGPCNGVSDLVTECKALLSA